MHRTTYPSIPTLQTMGVLLELVSAVIWHRQGGTLDKQSVHHRATLKDK